MQKHVKVYMNHFGIGETDVWRCEACGREFQINNGLNIHHIYGRIGQEADAITNIMCLCVKCHERAHHSKYPVSKDQFQLIHNYFMMGDRRQFL